MNMVEDNELLEKPEDELAPCSPSDVSVPDPSRGGSKKLKAGLMVPAIVFLVAAMFMSIISWLLFSSAREILANDDAAAKIVGGFFMLIFYFVSAAVTLLLSVPGIGLSIGALCSKKVKGKVLPIIVLVILVAIFASTLMGMALVVRPALDARPASD